MRINNDLNDFLTSSYEIANHIYIDLLSNLL